MRITFLIIGNLFVMEIRKRSGFEKSNWKLKNKNQFSRLIFVKNDS